MERRSLRRPASGSRWMLLLLLSLLIQSLDHCSSINDDGRALLRFRQRVEVDPYAALADWVATEGTANPCDWFGVECENGEVVALNLKDLCLKGTLAPELGKLIHLKSLVLQNNSFYGTIPKELGAVKSLEVLDLGNNDVSGPIPSDLWNILSSEFLNQFQGSMRSELMVDLCLPSSNERAATGNHGTATIRRLLRLEKEKNSRKKKKKSPSPSPAPSPSFLPVSPSPEASPHLPIFPSPQPSPASSPSSSPPTTRGPHGKELSPSTTQEHPPLPVNHTAHSPTFSIQSPPPSGSHSIKASHRKNHMIMFVGMGVGSFGLVAFLTICIYCYHGKKVVTVKPWTTGLSGQLQKVFITGLPQLKRSELETACEDFSNIIGSLSDCILYKGTLSSGVEIAVASTLVNSAKKWSKHSEAQFRHKVATLSKVNHKNFVNLLGYCEEEEPFTRMMVFEYAPNGTLFEHLHVKEAEDLNWAARLRIAMGIAYCLDHMHQLSSPVLLINLQSSTIYLTDDLAAKVSDFDFSSETTVAVTASASSSPWDERIPTPERTVYKFGILLLEIISGRLPYSQEDGPLLDWAADYLMGPIHLRDIVDPTLRTSRDEDVSAISEVIRRCCNLDPQKRPTMEEVALRLRDITAVPPDGAIPRSSPLWWAELEILSTDAN